MICKEWSLSIPFFELKNMLSCTIILRLNTLLVKGGKSKSIMEGNHYE